jgi:hypothetical protein
MVMFFKFSQDHHSESFCSPVLNRRFKPKLRRLSTARHSRPSCALAVEHKLKHIMDEGAAGNPEARHFA